MSIAVQVTCAFFDQVVEDTIQPRGRRVVLGGTDVLAVPRPADLPYLAVLTWRGDRVVVKDGHGDEHVLTGSDGVVTIQEGPIRLELRLVRRFRLRRLASTAAMVSTSLSAILLTMLIGAIALVPAQVSSANTAYCKSEIGQMFPPNGIPFVREVFACPMANGANQRNIGGDFTAEYLERILKEDFDGEDRGVIAKRGDRQYGEREDDSFYLPAGDRGDPETMGGAKKEGLRPIRTETTKVPEPERTPKQKRDALAMDNGTPVDLPNDDFTNDDDGIVDEDPEEIEEDPEELRERQEDREGWGVKDWYDQDEKRLDQLRIDAAKGFADRILKIDPNDSEALALLSYYQYLDEDYEGAEETYDKYIQLNPEDPAGYNNKALIYKRTGEYEREESLYELALALKPDDVTALNNLAVNYAHQGRYEEALAVMERLEVMDPGEPYADLHRAKIHAEMGNDAKALEYLKSSLEGMRKLDTLHHIEFRQDIRIDPSFARLRDTRAFREILWTYYGDDTPLPE